MKTMKSVLPKASMIFLIFTLLCGVIYTGVVTGIAQLIFSDNANGSIIEVDGKKYGCELLGQQYALCGNFCKFDESKGKDGEAEWQKNAKMKFAYPKRCLIS